jgi:hypothetical protein
MLLCVHLLIRALTGPAAWPMATPLYRLRRVAQGRRRAAAAPPDRSLLPVADSAGVAVRSSVVFFGEVLVRRDWIFGLGAVSTLAVLVGLDLLVALVHDRGLSASQSLQSRWGTPPNPRPRLRPPPAQGG